MKNLMFYIFPLILLLGCEEELPLADAYGNFEATVTVVSAETSGKIVFLDLDEGENLDPGTLVGLIDTTDLHLQRSQIEARIASLPKKLRTAFDEIEVLRNKKANLVRERDRIARLVAKKAATSKALDDMNGQIEVIDQQMEVVKTQTNTANSSILSESGPLLAQIDLIENQIRKSYIYNPVRGTVLDKLSEPYEIARMGTPLYRIARLDTLTLLFYTTSIQLNQLAIGQKVNILTDATPESIEGIVSWISAEAEFTPKTIQTREDRVHLVYAAKARVPNKSGLLKIGMPGELTFSIDTVTTPVNGIH